MIYEHGFDCMCSTSQVSFYGFSATFHFSHKNDAYSPSLRSLVRACFRTNTTMSLIAAAIVFSDFETLLNRTF